jgi:hypothetical protein
MSRHLSKYYADITNLDNFEYQPDNKSIRMDKKNAFVQYIRDNNLIYTDVWDNVPVGSPYIHINFGPTNKKLVCPEEFPQTKESEKWLESDGYDEDGFIMLNSSSSGSYARGKKSRSKKSKSRGRKTKRRLYRKKWAKQKAKEKEKDDDV